MIIEQGKAEYSPVTVTFQTLEEFKHFIACMSISDGDRKASAKACGFELDEAQVSGLAERMWNLTEDIRKVIPDCN